ncbi:MAG: GWxTD domain-containing protein [Flavobacteriales bacterium]|jgi:GWxTD domain-containing protein
MRYVYTIFISCAAFLLLQGCTSTATNVQEIARIDYDWESSPFHPEFQLYHFSSDSSSIMLKIKSKELLYTRKDPAASFEAHISCWMLIEEKTTEGFIFIDSTTLNIVDANPDQTSRLVVSSSQFQLPLSSNPYRLTLKLKDKNRRWEQTEYLYTSKDEVPSRDDFQLYTNGSDLSVFGNKVHTGDFLKIKSDRFQQNWKHISWDDKTRLPAPPYTETRFELPFPEDTTKLVWDEGSVGKEISEGRLSLFDDRSQHVLTLLVTNDYFPEVRMIDEMIQSLRYISSKREFERINATKANRKKELDKFWLDCGGSKERSRELIRIYYRRVEEANYYFSSYVEGWKSDRGLIHIVFGNPNRINHGADYETWTYGEENNLSSVTFNFRKVDNALSENHLVLERNPIFRTQWDRAITAWRNGRIFQE